MMLPVIGMPSAVEESEWGSWRATAALLPQAYALAVQRAGGLAVILPPDSRVADEPDLLLDRLDGLLLAGGADMDSASYGAEPHAETRATFLRRDDFELALVRRAVERDLPVLGICRGMQVLNVAAGGDLQQHLPDVLGHDRHRHAPGVFADHGVRIEGGSLTARVVGDEHTDVKSHHHQGPDRLGRGVVPTGWAKDGSVEAIELPDRRFALGVLWHPEEDEASRVIGTFVDEARERMEVPAG